MPELADRLLVCLGITLLDLLERSEQSPASDLREPERSLRAPQEGAPGTRAAFDHDYEIPRRPASGQGLQDKSRLVKKA